VLPASPSSEVKTFLRGRGSSSLLPVGQASTRCVAVARVGGATAAAGAGARPRHGRRRRRRRRDGRRHHLGRGGAPGRPPGGLLVALVWSGVDGRSMRDQDMLGRLTVEKYVVWLDVSTPGYRGKRGGEVLAACHERFRLADERVETRKNCEPRVFGT